MTFKQAEKKLAKIANGNYYSLSYEVAQHPGVAPVIKCRVYIHNQDYYEGTTWNKAFARLAGKKINTELTEAPTQEA